MQADVSETAVVLDGDELDVGSLGGSLVGLVTGDSDGATSPGRHPAPHIAIGERALCDDAVLDGPPVELVERGYGSVPGGCRDAVGSIVMPAGTMIGIDIVTGRLPDGLGSGLVQEAHPDKQIVGVAAQAVL